MKRFSFLLLVLLINFTSCTGLPVSPEVITQSASQTPGATQTARLTPRVTQTYTIPPTATFTRISTRTAESTPTLTPTPSRTPTYNPLTAKSITPVPIAVCPVVNASYQPAFADQVLDGFWYRHDLSGPILDALNQGAGLPALKRAVARSTYDGEPAGIPPDAIYAKDLTGDRVPEIIFDEKWLTIYTCQEGAFREVLKWNSGITNRVEKPAIVDMNLDGLAEIVAPTCFMANYVSEYYFNILHWDGTEFINLISEEEMTFNGMIQWSVRDVDRNGPLELIIRNWPPTSPDAELHGPWRYETSIFTWNGVSFTLQPMVLDPPEYRFQAVQDGDRAMRRGAYLQAIPFFRQAIDDPNLKGWGYSLEHQLQRQQALDDLMMQTPTPTLLPLDPNEDPHLKAYAGFRLLIAYAAEQKRDLAKAEYQALQNGYPSGRTGDVYARLGRLFWDGYEKEGSVPAGCQKVMEYAQVNPQLVLEPLNQYLGFQNIFYDTVDLCPYPGDFN